MCDATSFILSFVCFNSPQTPVSEDTTALFGPPLDTAFGEPKNEGNRPSLSLHVFVSVVVFCLKVIATHWKKGFLTHIYCLFKAASKALLGCHSRYSFFLSPPLTYFSNIIVLPSGSLCSSGFTPSVFAKVKVEIGSGRSLSCTQCSSLLFRFGCHPLSSNPVGFSSAGWGRIRSCYATAMSGITNINSRKFPAEK